MWSSPSSSPPSGGGGSRCTSGHTRRAAGAGGVRGTGWEAAGDAGVTARDATARGNACAGARTDSDRLVGPSWHVSLMAQQVLPVSESWRRIDAWLAARTPSGLALLNPPAGPGDLQRPAPIGLP